MDIRPPGDGAESVELEDEESEDPENCFTDGEGGRGWGRGRGRVGEEGGKGGGKGERDWREEGLRETDKRQKFYL